MLIFFSVQVEELIQKTLPSDYGAICTSILNRKCTCVECVIHNRYMQYIVSRTIQLASKKCWRICVVVWKCIVMLVLFFFFYHQTEVYSQSSTQHFSKKLCGIHFGTSIQNLFTGNKINHSFQNFCLPWCCWLLLKRCFGFVFRLQGMQTAVFQNFLMNWVSSIVQRHFI